MSMNNLAGKIYTNSENTRYEELREKLTFGINLAIHRMIERSKKLDENIVISKDNKILIIRALDL
jgi:hypothetical protein